MGSKIVNIEDNANLSGTTEHNGKSEKRNRVYSFFIADENQETQKTSTNREKRNEKKGALNNEQSVNFFLPEWF